MIVYIHLRSALHGSNVLSFYRCMKTIALLSHFLHYCNKVSKLNFLEHLLHTSLHNLKLLSGMGFNVVL